MIRIGIIGCGKIAEVRHAPEFNENSHCKITAFYNRTTETAERFARQYGGKVYTSVEDLLSSDVDAVSVCVANSQHAAITIRALEAGKHVLCEKPMATTLEDCEDMVQASKDSGKYLMIAMNQRLAKAHIEAKKIIDSGEMGILINASRRLGLWRIWGYIKPM